MTSTGNSVSRSASTTQDPEQDERFHLIGRIASGLAHELNGPIGIALGFSELAREVLAKTGATGIDADGVKKISEYLGLVENAGLRARSLARQIWNFAKSELGTISNFDLVEAVDNAASLSAPAVKVSQIEIGRRAVEWLSPLIVRGDQALLTHALVRLFLDSVKALPQGGNVYWEIESGGGGRRTLILAAEPWGVVPSAKWPVHRSVIEVFRSQGGSISDATERAVEGSESNPAPSSPGWYVTASLPAAADN